MTLDTLLDSLLQVPPIPQSNTLREPLSANQNKAGSLGSPGSSTKLSLLDQAIVIAVGDLQVTPVEIRKLLDEYDIESWNNSRVSTSALVHKALCALSRYEISNGKIPINFGKKATCQRCGPIWMPHTGTLVECPWCENRIKNIQIPRPQAVCCIDCTHFKCTTHLRLGHCAKGEPEAIAGIWDDDKRLCNQYYQKQYINAATDLIAAVDSE